MNGMDWESRNTGLYTLGKTGVYSTLRIRIFPMNIDWDKSYIANAEDGRACIQAAQLEVKDSRLVYNRNQ